LSPDKPRNLAASVHQRLLTLARTTGQDFGLILTRYGLERLLYRLSKSRHAEAFVLKGALLFQAWTSHTHRPTRDIDLLGQGEYSTARFKRIFEQIFSQGVEDDGLVYLSETITVETMKDEEEYPGLRVSGQARLGKARIPIQIDIGFGDAITPGPIMMDYPTLLPFPAPHVAAYPVETVVSEKFEAIVKLGIANSRMKDFFDIGALARDFAFGGAPLAEAVKATFSRRKTNIPVGLPFAFTPEFYEDAVKRTQWEAFLGKNKLPGKSLADTIAALTSFLIPVASAAKSSGPFPKRWNPGGPWIDE